MDEPEPTQTKEPPAAEPDTEVPTQPEPPEDPNLLLTRTFLDALTSKGLWVPPVTCPVCRHDLWEVSFAGDLPQRYVPGKVLTFIPVRCTTCQHTIFFNAVGLGLFNEQGMPRGETSATNPPVAPDETGS